MLENMVAFKECLHLDWGSKRCYWKTTTYSFNSKIVPKINKVINDFNMHLCFILSDINVTCRRTKLVL